MIVLTFWGIGGVVGGGGDDGFPPPGGFGIGVVPGSLTSDILIRIFAGQRGLAYLKRSTARRSPFFSTITRPPSLICLSKNTSVPSARSIASDGSIFPSKASMIDA